jgi:hypothetical protein
MIRFFRRNRPTPAPFRLTPSEAITASAWGLSQLDWLDLPDSQRAYYRENLTHAPRFKGAP